MDVCGILGLWYCSIQSVFLSFSYAVIMEFNFKWYNGMNHIPSYFGLLGWSLPTLDSFHALPCIRWDFLFVWALMYNQMSDFNGCIITYYCKQYNLNKPMSVPFFQAFICEYKSNDIQLFSCGFVVNLLLRAMIMERC